MEFRINPEYEALLPSLSDEEYESLKESIINDGQHYPIIVNQYDIILDGHQRYRVCQEIGMECDYIVKEFDNPLLEKKFVVETNLKRRQLADYQKYELDKVLIGIDEQLAQDRLSEAGKIGRDIQLGVVSGDTKPKDTGRTREKSAKRTGLSPSTIARAQKIDEKGTEEQKEALRKGELGIRTVYEKIRKEEKKEEKSKEMAHVGRATGYPEWYTPAYIIELARELMGTIDVDPASSDIANEIVKATTYYTVEDNGLIQTWEGNVWMNPPYSQPIVVQFCNLLVEKYRNGEIEQACVLVNNATETEHYQNMLKYCEAVCFIKTRVKFLDINKEATGAPLQGQTILYFGENIEEFGEIFSELGIILYAKREICS